jgi:hypothetical protein
MNTKKKKGKKEEETSVLAVSLFAEALSSL